MSKPRPMHVTALESFARCDEAVAEDAGAPRSEEGRRCTACDRDGDGVQHVAALDGVFCLECAHVVGGHGVAVADAAAYVEDHRCGDCFELVCCDGGHDRGCSWLEGVEGDIAHDADR